MLEWISNIGGFSFIAYAGVRIFSWMQKNYLSSVESKILKEMLINNHRLIFKPERSDYPLHIKMNGDPKPFPSENRSEIIRYYEKFQKLLEKGFICHGVDEIYILTSKGIVAATKLNRTGNRIVDKAFKNYFS